MTGSAATDYSLLAVLSVILGFVARHYGSDLLAKLADALRSKSQPQPEQPQPEQPQVQAQPQQLFGMTGASLLSFLIPFLMPLIQQLIAELEKSLGRPATTAEKQEVADKVTGAYIGGKVKLKIEE